MARADSKTMLSQKESKISSAFGGIERLFKGLLAPLRVQWFAVGDMD